jgi:CubicO group peptidase (beta-lactamase class C family)
MTGRTLLRTIATMALVVLVAPLTALAQQPDLRVRLNAAIPDLMRTGDVPGLEAAVIRDGRLYWSGAFGVREATSPDRVVPTTIFRAASLTKPLFAYLVLRLADKGIIDLDAPVTDKLPYIAPTTDPRVRAITPRMLLSHSSGIPNCCGPHWTLIADPGTTWDYSPKGYDWLGALVVQVTGSSLDELARREIFGPLGMTHSSLIWNDSLESNAASPHTMWGRVARPQRPPTPADNVGFASGSMRTTAEDYAKFLIAAMDGKGLSARSAPLLFTAQVELRNAPTQREKSEALRNRMAWALGFGVARTDSSEEFWQWGDFGDSKAFVIGDVKRRTAVVYFANAQTGLTIAGNIVSMVFPGEPYPLTMLGYPSIDDVPRLARRAIVHVGLDSGAAAAARRLETEWAERPANAPWEQVQAAAGALGDEHALAAADTLLALAAHRWPDSVDVRIARGDLALTLGASGSRAAAYYQQALGLAPTNATAQVRLRWSLDDASGRAHPAIVPEAELQAFTGAYGQWTISRDGGRLFYRRWDGPASPLIALSADTFVPENDAGTRFHFANGVLTQETYAGEHHPNARNP